jgi:hypothetical protein
MIGTATNPPLSLQSVDALVQVISGGGGKGMALPVGIYTAGVEAPCPLV